MRRAFTLIELLVVIAIIALLVAILLPALTRARSAARVSLSLSNVRQLNTASQTYRHDHKGFMPLTMWFDGRRTAPASRTSPTIGLRGFCSWNFAGKDNDVFWAGQSFDVPMADRVMNPYLVAEDIVAPPRPTPITTARGRQQMEMMRDPSDNGTFQRTWNPSNPQPNRSITGYNDVGTSYQYQSKWFTQIYNAWPGGQTSMGFYQSFNYGALRMALADAFQPSKMVWVYDQYADVIANANSPGIQFRNGFGDVNTSVMGFMDGHAKYIKVIPGSSPASFSNAEYSMTMEFLKLPTTIPAN